MKLEIESFKCGGKVHYAPGCPSKRKGKKVMQPTWSDTKSYKLKESNERKERINPTIFMESVIEDPLKKEKCLVNQVTP